MNKLKEIKDLIADLKDCVDGNGVPNIQYISNRIDDLEKVVNTINYIPCCTELRDKETPKIEDWLKNNFKRLDRHSFTNTHEDTIWLRSELVEVYNQLHP